MHEYVVCKCLPGEKMAAVEFQVKPEASKCNAGNFEMVQSESSV